MVAIIDKNKPRILELCREFGVKRLELFGSATNSSFDSTRSDIDLLVEFEPSKPAEHADRYFGLLAALREIFGRQVDLVELKAVRNPYFKENIEASKVTLYGA